MFKQLLKTITKDEWLFVALISGLLIIITIFPVILAYCYSPFDNQYNGLNIIGLGDYSVYFSYINQVKSGQIFLLNYFTGETQTRGVFNIFWLGVGVMAKIFNLQAWIAYHLSRLLMIPIFCIIFYIFSAYIFKEKRLRAWCLAFAAFASGLGGFLAFLIKHNFAGAFNWLEYSSPLDLWVTESNIFFSAYLNPHFILSLGLMVLFFLLLLLAWENKNYIFSLGAGLTGLVWFNFHPYYAPYVLAITFVYLVYLLWRYKKISLIYHFLLANGIGFISVAYHYLLIKNDYVIGTRTMQNITLTPPFLFVATGFGLLLFFSFVGVFYLAKKNHPLPDRWVFLLIWLIVGLNLLYAPLSFNRRFTEGLEIPMIFLTVYALSNIVKFVRLKWKKIGKILTNQAVLIFLFVIFFCSTTIFIVSRDIYFIAKHYSPFYDSEQYLLAIKFLRDQKSDKVILANLTNGHYLPGLINEPVFIGHGHETVNFTAKEKMYNDFYGNKYTPELSLKFLKDNNIGYIIYSYWEKGNMAINLYNQPYLSQVFVNNQITIYQVKY